MNSRVCFLDYHVNIIVHEPRSTMVCYRLSTILLTINVPWYHNSNFYKASGLKFKWYKIHIFDIKWISWFHHQRSFNKPLHSGSKPRRSMLQFMRQYFSVVSGTRCTAFVISYYKQPQRLFLESTKRELKLQSSNFG